MLKATNISKNYGTLEVLSKVYFVLEKGQKVALVGNNGTGKTTLLKILAGLEESDGGSFEPATDMRIGYLPQDTGLMREQTIRSYFKNETNSFLDHNASETLAGLGLKNISLDRKLSSFSSGQKTKVGLAQVLLEEPDLLLLDEPTNNLDIPALIWLEKYLKKSSSACIIVSHDRKFLDRVTGRVFELNNETHSLKVENGKYTEFLERKLKAINRQKEMYQSQQEKIKRLTIDARKKREKEIKGANKKPTDNDKFLKGFKSDRAGKKLTSTAKLLEEKVERIDKIERIVERPPLHIDLEAEYTGGQADIELKDVEIKYKNGFALGPVSFQINYGKRFGFIGLNGSGKTTLLKIISGDIKPDRGGVEIGSAVRIGNLTQEHGDLPRDATVFDFFQTKLESIKILFTMRLQNLVFPKKTSEGK